MAKQYDSFSEIDHQLQILRLQREIDRENIKLHFNRTRENLSPTHWIGSLGGVIKKIVLALVLKKLSLLFRKSMATSHEGRDPDSISR